MKRLVLFMLTLFCFGICNAQINLSKLRQKCDSKNNLEKYEFYLDKSTKFQAGAIGSAAVSVGCFIGYACQKEKFELKSKGKVKMTDKAKTLLICGGLTAACAVACELVAIEYKLESGKALKMHLNGLGANVSLNF